MSVQQFSPTQVGVSALSEPEAVVLTFFLAGLSKNQDQWNTVSKFHPWIDMQQITSKCTALQVLIGIKMLTE